MIYIWGPKIWYFFHTVTYNYPLDPSENDKKLYKHFFNDVIFEVLPCDYCRYDYLEKINKYKIDDYLNSRDRLINWGINIHNLVNRDTRKRRFSFEESNKIYLNKINHTLIFNLMKYYSDWTLRDIHAVGKFKKILKYIILFFPCVKCKPKLINWYDNNVKSCKDLHIINRQIIYLSTLNKCV